MTDGPLQPQELKALAEDAGARLDHFLVTRCPEFSRSNIQKTITGEGVTVNGQPQPSRYRMNDGDVVVFVPLPQPPSTAVAEDLPLDIVHQDEHLLVINKAAGMVTHPAPGNYTGTLVNALNFRFKNLPGGDEMRAGIVHRLDRDTSGLMVVALSDKAHAHLSGQLQSRTLGRVYHALSWGQWDEDEGIINLMIARHPTKRKMMSVVEMGGKTAVTRYTLKEDYGYAQYCRVELETGRTHQIRVHFAHYGHQIVGDQVYGDDGRVKNLHPLDQDSARTLVDGLDRQMLHAAELHLIHPQTGEQMTFQAPLPADFTGALEILRNKKR
jgi:23S rRNA pseudouridine1911/1915/1917 synthase